MVPYGCTILFYGSGACFSQPNWCSSWASVFQFVLRCLTTFMMFFYFAMGFDMLLRDSNFSCDCQSLQGSSEDWARMVLKMSCKNGIWEALKWLFEVFKRLAMAALLWLFHSCVVHCFSSLIWWWGRGPSHSNRDVCMAMELMESGADQFLIAVAPNSL